MTISLIAIASVMAVSCAFGYVLRGIVDNARKTESEWFTDGLSADHDRWEDEPVPTMPCRGCLHEETSMFDEPCLSCIQTSDWEKKR